MMNMTACDIGESSPRFIFTKGLLRVHGTSMSLQIASLSRRIRAVGALVGPLAGVSTHVPPKTVGTIC